MSDKKPVETVELYGGEVVINYHPTSHRYYLTHLNGEKLPRQRQLTSVTGITGQVDKSRALMPWATRMYTERVRELMGEGVSFTRDDLESMLNSAERAYEEVRDKAAGIGDYVHLFAERYSVHLDPKEAYSEMVAELGYLTDEDRVKVDAGVVGLTDWLKKEKIEIESAEKIVYSKKHDYVGKFDAIIKHNGKRYLADYKTSNGIYDEYYYQTAAYLKAYEEETGEKLDGAVLVAIVKEDKEGANAGDILPEFRSRQDLLKDHVAFKGLVALKGRAKELQAEWYAKNRK